jgi:hypothetical protein
VVGTRLPAMTQERKMACEGSDSHQWNFYCRPVVIDDLDRSSLELKASTTPRLIRVYSPAVYLLSEGLSPLQRKPYC